MRLVHSSWTGDPKSPGQPTTDVSWEGRDHAVAARNAATRGHPNVTCRHGCAPCYVRKTCDPNDPAPAPPGARARPGPSDLRRSTSFAKERQSRGSCLPFLSWRGSWVSRGGVIGWRGGDHRGHVSTRGYDVSTRVGRETGRNAHVW